MKSKIAASCLIISLVMVSFFFHQEDHAQVTSPPRTLFAPSTTLLKEKKSSKEAKKHMANRLPSAKQQAKKLMLAIDASSLEFEFSFSSDHHLISHMLAIPKKDYKVGMGDIFYQDQRFHYLKSDPDFNLGKPVVYLQKSNKLAPLSSIIKIESIDGPRRNEILSLGFKESLYLKELKILFIETNTFDYLEIYQALGRAGFAPQHQLLSRSFSTK